MAGSWRSWTPSDARFYQERHKRTYDERLCHNPILRDGADTWRSQCALDQLATGGFYHNPCVRTFDPIEFLLKIRGKTLSFYGDSLNGQFFESLLCSLSPAGALVKITRDGPAGVSRVRATFTHSTVIQYVGTYGVHCPECKDRHAHDPRSQSFQQVMDTDWLVLNIGAHYTDEKVFQHDLAIMDADIRQHIRSNAKLLWREYSPAHFRKVVDYRRAEDTEVPGVVAKHQKCWPAAFPRAHNKVEDLRRNWANNFMGSSGYTIVPLFAISAGRWSYHAEANKAVDCRHWCNPSPVLDAWTQILAHVLEETSRRRDSSTAPAPNHLAYASTRKQTSAQERPFEVS